ncbi:dTDP-4-dehydrorhamnose reductase [Candidatus Margulisiibacteriota bacterium]
MKVAITGAKGMLASALIPLLKEHELISIDLPEVDITDKKAVEKGLAKADFVFHFAAFTDVDGAELAEKKVFDINEHGTENIALVCKKLGIPLLYISTDYVFSNGKKTKPWAETDKPNIEAGVYARSKLAGEQAVQRHCQKYFIVRTAWLYGQHGLNFIDTILKKAKETPELKVVDDQKGTPTYTRHLARALVKFLDIKEYGIYHLTNQGETSWYGLAKKVFELSGNNIKIIPCRTEDFPRPAPRPKYAVLGNAHWLALGQEPLPSWEEGVREYLKELKQ